MRIVSRDELEQLEYQPRSARHAVGDAVAWVPRAFIRTEAEGVPVTLSGSVIYVNDAHRYYTVEAGCNGYMIRESYKY